MSTESEADWSIDCSDDELYNIADRLIAPFNQLDEIKIWEPDGQKIAQLYQQIEKEGYIELKWICPGRRSPSSQLSNNNDKSKQVEQNDSKSKSVEINEFDFDEEQFEKCNNFPKTTPKRRTVQGQRKVTKLDKVMNDMKKYHILDQQGS